VGKPVHAGKGFKYFQFFLFEELANILNLENENGVLFRDHPGCAALSSPLLTLDFRIMIPHLRSTDRVKKKAPIPEAMELFLILLD
jgi:hypothetical protein